MRTCTKCKTEEIHSKDSMDVEESVIAKIRMRRDMGRKKYGVSMERTDFDALTWMKHAQEESMDFCIYLERLIRDEQKRINAKHPKSHE